MIRMGVMTKMFEDLQVWQSSRIVTNKVYASFGLIKDYAFRDQIQRASVSIMNNIAEWYDRETEKEKKRFFVMAKWSCAEVRSMLYIANDLDLIDESEFVELKELVTTLSKQLSAFIKKFTAE